MAHEPGVTTTKEKVESFEVTMPLVEAMYSEFKDLSKKKPEGAVSKAKIKVVNRLLAKCREVLGAELSIEYLDLLDEDDVPQNSDVVLTLSQYVAAMEAFRSRYHGWDGRNHSWATEEG